VPSRRIRRCRADGLIINAAIVILSVLYYRFVLGGPRGRSLSEPQDD
jgi:hypothetical protein